MSWHSGQTDMRSKFRGLLTPDPATSASFDDVASSSLSLQAKTSLLKRAAKGASQMSAALLNKIDVPSCCSNLCTETAGSTLAPCKSDVHGCGA